MVDDINEADPADLIGFGNAWRDLGDVIQKQVEWVLDDPDSEVNPNAIRLAADALRQWPSVADPLQAWLSERDEQVEL